MSLKANNVQSPFTDLMEHQNGETILDLFNTIHDAIFKFKNINDDDAKELSELVSKYSGDHLFNSFLTKFFVNGMNAFTLKSTIQNLSEFPSCTLSSALHVLSDIYDKTENEMIKGYLLFLTFDIEHFINFALDDWKKVRMADTLFNHYIFDEALPKYLKRYLSIALVNHGYCLLSFFCQYDSAEPSVIPALTKYANISIKWELCTSVKSIFSQIINNYELLNEKVVSAGFDIEGSFENAVKLFSYVANNWDNLSATFTLRNKPLPTGTSDYTLSGGARVSDSDLVKIFAGQYSLVPYSSSYAKSPTLDVIADFDAYNELPNKRKLQVAGFLINNRKRFNDVMGEAAQIVINGLHSKLNASNVSSAFDGGQFYSLSARNVGFGQNDDSIISDAKNFMSKLSKKFNDAPMATFDNAISFIVHQYLPMLNQFQNKCNEAYGVADSRLLLDKCSTNKTLNALGVASFVPSIIGGKKRSIQPQNNEVSEPQEVPTTSAAPTIQEPSEPSEQEVYGASAAEDLVKSFITGQRNFNKEYEILYRKLISALNAVSISNVHAQTISKLYSVCNQFDSIAIKRAKTTSFISGYYGAKNYNKLYTKCVENTIHSIELANVPAFNDVVAILNQLKDLLIKTAQEVKELRIKYITSPKSVSETLIVEAKRIKTPCALTQKDFNAFTEAINRIYNTIRNYSSESATYNTRQQLNSYLEKIEDRTRVIKEHYDLKIQGITIKYQQYPTTRERQYALDAEKSIITQIKDIMLYLNKTFDVKLAKERINHLHTVNLTQEQVDNIEKAFLAFKNVKVSSDFKHEMEKLNNVLNPHQVGSVFKIVKRLRKLIEKSQYVQFLAQLYKELHIFDEDFDWNEFIEKYTSLVVLSCIKIECLYSVGENYFTPEHLIHQIATLFETEITTNKNNAVLNAGYNFIVDLLKRSNSTEHSLPSTVKELFDASVSKNNANYGNATTNFDIDANEANGTDLTTAIKGIFEKGIFDNDGTNDRIIYSAVAKLVNAYEQQPSKPFYYTRILYFAKCLRDSLASNVPNSFKQFLDKSITRLDNWSVSITESNSETWIADFTIESLFANVIAIVDKYWAIKYNGVLPIPLNINTILRGGSIDDEEVEGGSVFDSMPLHDQSFSNIIVEAVPFYICALHIISYYISSFSINKVKNADEKHISELQLVLSVNKVSSLYPIYEIFHKYQASIKTLTPQQLKICLSVLNEYWGQTQGNEAARLSRAIDLIFNELNSCFIFTDKLQYELMKSTNSLSKTSIDIINSKLDLIVNKMKDQLNSSVIETHEDPAQQSKRLEGLLNFAFNEVKRSPETQRLSILKSLLSKDDNNGELRDYYTFMETVITPLLICAKSYMYIFSLFDNYTIVSNDGKNEPELSIDLSTYYIEYKDYDQNEAKEISQSVWDIINDIRRKGKYWKKSLFMENFVVRRYNQIKLEETFQTFHRTGHFAYPDFWLVMDESTYPTSPKLEVKISNIRHCIETTHLLRQIYPTVDAKNVGDYYNYCITEFIADYDHFIHAFMSYPGLSDKTIKTIAKKAHDAFKISNVPANNKSINNESEDGFSNKGVYNISPSDENLYKNAQKLAEIPISKVNYYIPPMAPAVRTIIPVFTEGGTLIEELEIVDTIKSEYRLYPAGMTRSVDMRTSKERQEGIHDKNALYDMYKQNIVEEPQRAYRNVAIDNTSMYIKSASAAQDSITSCEYTWLDWVLYMIARCNKINYCVPYRLLQLLQDSSSLAQYLRTPGFFKVSSQNFQKYNRFSSGAYGNIITQNIIARSVSNWNKDRTDLASLGATWTASIISVLPFIISKLVAVKLSTNQSVVYGGMSVYQHLTQLIEVLTMFYDELSNYTPFIPFMASSITINATRVRPHLFAELLSIIDNQELGDLESSDFIKLEWANQHFFTGIDGLTFPEYKNRDRFEWIKQFGNDKLANGTFKTEFDSSVQSLGRIVWAGLIAKSRNYIITYNDQFKELDDLIREVMMYMCEVDTKIAEELIQNIIKTYMKQNGIYGNTLSGGKITFTFNKKDELKDDELEMLSDMAGDVIDINIVRLQTNTNSKDPSRTTGPNNTPRKEGENNTNSKDPARTTGPNNTSRKYPESVDTLKTNSTDKTTDNSNEHATHNESIESLIQKKDIQQLLITLKRDKGDHFFEKLNTQKYGNTGETLREAIIEIFENETNSFSETARKLESWIAAIDDRINELQQSSTDYKPFSPLGINSPFTSDQTNNNEIPIEALRKYYNKYNSKTITYDNANIKFKDIKLGDINFENIKSGVIDEKTTTEFLKFVAFNVEARTDYLCCLNPFISWALREVEAAHESNKAEGLLQEDNISSAGKVLEYYRALCCSDKPYATERFNDLLKNNDEKTKEEWPSNPSMKEEVTLTKTNKVLKANEIVEHSEDAEWLKTTEAELKAELKAELEYIDEINQGLSELNKQPLSNSTRPQSSDSNNNAVSGGVIHPKEMFAYKHIIRRLRNGESINKYEYDILNNNDVKTLFGKGINEMVDTQYNGMYKLKPKAKNEFNERLNNNIVGKLIGGLLPSNLVDLARELAITVAHDPHSHCVYIDKSQNINSCPPTNNVDNLFYKYLYNPYIFPSVCRGCDYSEVVSCAAYGKRFIINYETNIGFKKELILVEPKINEKIKDKLKFADDPIITDEEIFKNKYTDNTTSSLNTVTGDIIDKQIDSRQYLVKFNKKPREHFIHVDDSMFLLRPLNDFALIYMFSPQKDIQNALVTKTKDEKGDCYNALCPTSLIYGYDDGSGNHVMNYTQFMKTLASKYENNKCINDANDTHSFDFYELNITSIQSNPIYIFIQSLLEANLDSVFSSTSALEINNFGFDYGSTKIMSGGILPSIDGGFNINDGFIRDLVNTHTSFDDIREIDILSHAYGTDKTNPGQQLYSYIFKNGFNNISSDTSLMFHLIMNYFHKYNISFNSMFNQLCFPSIIFNAAGLRLSITRLKDVVSIINDFATSKITKDDSNRYKAQVLTFAAKYLTMYVDENKKLTLDYVKDYKYQVGFNGPTRSNTTNDTLQSILNRIDDVTKKHGHGTIALSNQFIMPSISNNFMSEIVDYINPHATTKDNKNLEQLPSLFSTGIMSSLRHLDSITTYINVLFMLLKETSYYSHEYDRDMTYFNVQSPEAFSVI